MPGKGVPVLITSRDNDLIKKIIKLHRSTGRKRIGQYFIEGIRGVTQSLDVEAPIAEIVYSLQIYEQRGGEELVNRIRGLGLELIEIKDTLFKTISDTENPQHIMAVIDIKPYDAKEFLCNKDPLIVIADGIRDPGNLGTIIRTADAVEADGIFLLKDTVDPYSPKVVRSTMGSIFCLPMFHEKDTDELFSLLHEKGIRIIAADPEGDTVYWDADLKGGIGIIIGNEANGISQRIEKHIDQRVVIPMRGKAESLNAAVACGILLYRALEQRLT